MLQVVCQVILPPIETEVRQRRADSKCKDRQNHQRHQHHQRRLVRMVPRRGWDPLRPVEGEAVSPESVKGGEEGGEDAGVVQDFIDAAGGGKLRERRTRGRMLGAGCGGMVLDLVLELMDLVMNGAQDHVLAPEAGERKHAAQRQAADEERPAGDRHQFF
jgi:hypothetical protein